MIGKGRILLEGRSPHAHEQEALTFIREALPNSDPYYIWELVELVDPDHGRLLEIDAIILGYKALYLVEIKSGPGVYEGDSVDWYRTAPGEPTRAMEPPYKSTNFKAKVLRTLLQRRMKGAPCPWVQPLVFLSHPDTQLKLRNFGDQCVVVRSGLAKALKFHDFTGAPHQERLRPTNVRVARAIKAALESLGVRSSSRELMVGGYRLCDVLEDGPGFQDRAAVHAENEAFRRRARAYLVPEQTSVERRQQLRRAASREAQLLEDVKGHPNILRISDYVPDAPLGPTVLFDHFDGVPLDAFLRQHAGLSFDDRIALIEQIGRAVAHCHDKEVIHGGLSPSAVLVRAREDQRPECRLYNFQLGMSAEVSHTLHWSALATVPWAAYQAPELRRDPERREPAGDIFSLGALAYLILTGAAPAASASEADERLEREGHFDPSAAADGISAGIAEVVRNATSLVPLNRFESASEFLEYLLEEATAPDRKVVEAEQEPNPLEAKKGDALAGFVVHGVLGQGASSRVLHVERLSDSRFYALKVALTEEDQERLLEEAAILEGLRSARIVPLVDKPVLGGRQCLLLGLAGSETLQRHLKQEGIVSLEYAARYGEDLLSAVEELEEHGILHRDIKPANVGVGSASKTRHHLSLFDFSLGLDLKSEHSARYGRSQISLGTSVYRDPYLRQRGGWDLAADRFSAAVTLYEMLTGARPSWEPEGAVGIDPDARLVLAAERFDASVRDRLTEFFTRALAADAAERHESASVMRQAWNQCFVASPAVSAPVPAGEPATAADDRTPGSVRAPSEPPLEEGLSDAALATLSADAPLAALRLSSRALNALDRAGLTTLGELSQLPDNRLSAVRGAGRLVAKEVLELRNRWRRHAAGDAERAQPFYPNYRGEDSPVPSAAAEGALDATWARELTDAGLRSLAVIAQAPEQQVERVAARASAPAALQQLRALLDAQQERAGEREQPTTLEAWLEALLPSRKKAFAHLEALFGLSGPFAGRSDATVAELAGALGMTRANLYTALGHARDHWRSHGALPELLRAAHGVVDRAGGAVSVARAAAALLDRLPSTELAAVKDDPTRHTAALEQARLRAAALLRIVGLVEREEEGGLRWERLPSGDPWLFAFEGVLSVVAELGRTADELAAREVLAASGEVVRVLRGVVGVSALRSLSDERLTELAAEASRAAARSSRLELYPRGLPPKRAIELSSAALTGPLTAEDVQRRVLARYPEAAPLPQGSELQDLLKPLGLLWQPDSGRFARPEERTTSALTSHTFLRPQSSVATALRPLDPATIERGKFEDAVRVALERGRFRVLAVRTDAAAAAAQLLTKTFGLRCVDLDREILSAMDRVAAELDVEPSLVLDTDRLGPASPDWLHLRELMERAASAVADALLPAREPLLLLNPGLIARFELSDFARRLSETNRASDAAAVFLLVPGPDTTGMPRINATFVLPEVGSTDALRVPPEWLRPASHAA